jgi:hypothetical protein
VIWAHVEARSVEDFCRAHEGLKTGLEPIDPDNPSKAMNRIELGNRHIRLEAGDAK